ncbi:hypothetical protein Dimus_026231, partial [Dionaea muscipula]
RLSPPVTSENDRISEDRLPINPDSVLEPPTTSPAACPPSPGQTTACPLLPAPPTAAPTTDHPPSSPTYLPSCLSCLPPPKRPSTPKEPAHCYRTSVQCAQQPQQNEVDDCLQTSPTLPPQLSPSGICVDICSNLIFNPWLIGRLDTIRDNSNWKKATVTLEGQATGETSPSSNPSSSPTSSSPIGFSRFMDTGITKSHPID